MKDTLRVQGGFWKNKSIPFPPEVAGNSHFTPALLKKASFGIIDSLVLDGLISLETTLFVDAFAGSGQLTAEAHSRGFGKVWSYELSQDRFRHLVKLYSKEKESIFLFRRDFFRFDPSGLSKSSQRFVVYFLDFPYSFWEERRADIDELLLRLPKQTPISSLVMVQSPKKIDLTHLVTENPFDLRAYGNQILHVQKNFPIP